MAFDSELAAKICSCTASPDAAALAELAVLEVDADALFELVVEELALALPLALALLALPPEEQPTRANAATRAIAHTAAKII